MNKIESNISAKIANMGILCAFLVLCIHAPISKEATDAARFFRAIWSHGLGKIAVPFFFVAAGFFLAGHVGEDGWWRREVGKRVRTLIVPLLLWCLIYFLISPIMALIANMIASRPLMTNIELIPSGNTLLRISALHPFEEPYLGVLWFVRMLIVLVIFSPFLVKLTNPLIILLLYSLQALVGPELGGTPIWWKFTLLKGFFPICGCAAFCFGAMLRFHKVSLAVSRKIGWLLIIFSFTLIFFRDAAYSRIGTLISWVYIPFLLVGVWSIMPTKRLPAWLTGASFPVYALHMIIFGFLKFPFKKLLGGVNTLPSYIAFVITSFIVCIGVAALMRRFLPRVSAVLFGGR